MHIQIAVFPPPLDSLPHSCLSQKKDSSASYAQQILRAIQFVNILSLFLLRSACWRCRLVPFQRLQDFCLCFHLNLLTSPCPFHIQFRFVSFHIRRTRAPIAALPCYQHLFFVLLFQCSFLAHSVLWRVRHTYRHTHTKAYIYTHILKK